jgi:FeS assembly SUF system regulator
MRVLYKARIVNMLRVTKLADYGVLIMTQFAVRPDATQNAKDVARSVRVPLPMASKILKILTREGLLSSHRGTKGGYSLTQEPKEISVAAVIRALEGPIAVTECNDAANGECDLEHGCPMRANWHRINQAIQEALERISLDEMMKPIEQPIVKPNENRSLQQTFVS